MSLQTYLPSTDFIMSKLHSHKCAPKSSFLASFESFESVASQLYPYQNFPAKGPTSKYLPPRSFDAISGSVARSKVVSAPDVGGMLVSLTIDEVMNEIQGGRAAESVAVEVPIVPNVMNQLRDGHMGHSYGTWIKTVDKYIGVASISENFVEVTCK
jgi:hypothetical protein